MDQQTLMAAMKQELQRITAPSPRPRTKEEKEAAAKAKRLSAELRLTLRPSTPIIPSYSHPTNLETSPT